MSEDVSKPASTVSMFQKVLAQLAWTVPLLLFALAADQADVALDLKKTLRDGRPAVATVKEYQRVDRADVTYGYVSLEVPLGDGSTISREKMSLPYSLIQKVEGVETLDVRVLSGGDQNVVITLVAETQWKIAAMQSAICLVAGIMALVAVLGWNRIIRRGSHVGRQRS